MPCSQRLRRVALNLIVASLWSASSLAAETLPSWAPQPAPRIIEDRLRVEVNLLGANFDTDIRVDESTLVRGTDINVEDDLGLDDSDLLPQVELTLLPGRHHLIRLSALSTDRSASKLIEQEIVFDDQVYRVNERVDSRLDLDLFGLTYGYRFLVRQRGELTATFGIQVAQAEANAVVRSRVVRESDDGVAPLPLVGIEGRVDFSRRWSAEARVQYLAADVEEVDGSILDARLALTWRMNPYLALGLGYRRFAIDVDSTDEDASGRIDLSIAGPLLFVRASL